MAQKLAPFLVLLITSSNSDQFSNLFRFQNQEKLCNNTITKGYRSHHSSRTSLHYLVKCQCLTTKIENKISVTTNFNKLTTRNNALIVSVIVESNCHILQFLHQMFNVSALLLDDALLKCVVTEVVLFSIVALKTLIFHNVVQRHTGGAVGSIVTILLQIFS